MCLKIQRVRVSKIETITKIASILIRIINIKVVKIKASFVTILVPNH